MKLPLDTTYLLPAIGIAIRGLEEDALIKLIGKGHSISISEITKSLQGSPRALDVGGIGEPLNIDFPLPYCGDAYEKVFASEPP